MTESIWLRTLGGLHRQRINRGVRRSAAAMPFRPASCYSRKGVDGRARVLHLEPIWRASRTVGRVLPLRHDTFEPHLAGMGEDGRAIALHMLRRRSSARPRALARDRARELSVVPFMKSYRAPSMGST
jgi:hypothetical protein